MKTKRTKTPQIRVGDRVRIVTPAFFVRCGYPLIRSAVRDELEADDARRLRIEAFVKGEGVGEDYKYRAYSEILDALAYAHLKQRGMGGRLRSIHTELNPEFAGKEGEVAAVAFVRTGTYMPGGISTGYYGDGEPEPAYLDDAKVHRILTLAGWGWRGNQIEAANVEVINGDAS